MSKKWLFLSVYYPQSAWGTLFKEAIIPFSRLHDQADGSAGLVHLGFNRGEYVGLTYQVDKSSVREFVHVFEKTFTSFFEQWPSVAPWSQVEPSGLYMNFASHTLCHSQHHFLPFVHQELETEYQQLWRRSTQCLLGQPDSLDAEGTFIMALYLNLLLLLSHEDLVDHYFADGRVRAQLEGGRGEALAHQLGMNAELFLTMRGHCLSVLQGQAGDDLSEIAAWFQVFRDFQNGYLSSGVGTELRLAFLKDMIVSTRRQLGVVNDTLLDYCLTKTIK